MLKEGQKIKVILNCKNRKWYEEKGYNKKYFEEFEVPPEDLPINSTQKVIVICDICKEEVEIEYRAYLKNIKKNKKFECINCYRKDKEKQQKVYEKVAKTNLEKYGIESPAKLDYFKEKTKEICKKKYGVEAISQADISKKHREETFLKKYGCHPLQTKEIREKVKKTTLEKYGVENVSQNEEIKEKIIQTNMERYGVPYTLLNEEIRKKGYETLLKLGKIPASSQ